MRPIHRNCVRRIGSLWYRSSMPLRVLIVPDKFKGTLTAQSAADSIAQGWRQVRPADHLELLPMSDGGDGFGEVLSQLMNAEARSVATNDAAHNSRLAQWWWEPKTKTVIIETAQVIGLALLPPGKFHPFELDSAGLGSVFKAASTVGSHRCLVGIGGSATNDGGFGMALSMGWTFVSASGEPINKWTQLDALGRIIPPKIPAGFPETFVAVDVQNALLGPLGASRVYGPQKGLRLEDMARAELCLEHLAKIAERDLGLEQASVPGDGAAGGLGFGLRSFLKAQLESGFKLFARYAGLKEKIASANLVITGEGAIDASTLMGKGVGEVAKLCKAKGVPCVGLAGTLPESFAPKSASNKFALVRGIVPELAAPEEARRNASVWLARLAADVAKKWPQTKE